MANETAFEYYCSYCGKKLTQDTVLYDMRRLLIEDENTVFNVLALRLTGSELRALIAGGAPAENGFRRCDLTLAQLMSYISNKNNLKDSRIAGLTLEQIRKYIEEPQVVSAPVKKRKTELGEGYPTEERERDEDEGTEEEAPVAEVEKDAQQEEPLPVAIQVLEKKVVAMVKDVAAKNILKSDLQILEQLFAQSDTYSVLMKEYTEVFDVTKKILIGYQMVHPVSGKNYHHVCRVCPKCGEQVFEHAGTAKHRAVVFIGNPWSGKTSTILALAHYAQNHMTFDDTISPIWSGARKISSTKSVELIGASKELKKHLRLYSEGIAPERTLADERKKAYSATFWITSANGKHYILTLTDLPGEICNKDGRNEVDEDKVLNEFQVAMSGDAFIACFDTAPPKGDDGKADGDEFINEGDDEYVYGHTVEEDVESVEWVEKKITMIEDPAEVINSICRQANTFQHLRSTQNQNADFIPTMLLFTKCKDLEEEKDEETDEKPEERKRAPKPMERVYMFREEKEIIERDGVYKAVCQAFGRQGELSKAYHAMLRCSPFGYPAPTEGDVNKKHKAYHTPKPKNIDKLMRWILMVSGCIPVEGRFCPTLLDDGGGMRTENYYLGDTQYRSRKPTDGWVGMEALSRMALFENPGLLDRVIVENYGQNWGVVTWHKIKYANKRNDNDHE